MSKKLQKTGLKESNLVKFHLLDKPRKSVHQNKTKYKSKGLQPIGRISKNHTIANNNNNNNNNNKTKIRKQTNKQNRKGKLLLAV